MYRKGKNIYKLKNRRCEGRYIKGKDKLGHVQYVYVHAKGCREAKRKIMSQNITNQAESLAAEIKNIKFSVIANNWLIEKKVCLKYSSYIKYKNVLNGYILPYFKDYRINNISYSDVTAFLSQLMTTAGTKNTGLSNKTVSDVLSIFQAILCYAKKKKGICIEYDAKNISIKHEKKYFNIISKPNQTILLTYIKNNISYKNIGILISLCTGLRIGEVCALRWEDISFDDYTVYIHHTMQRIQTENDPERKTKIIITEPKSISSIRKIPLPSDLVNILNNSLLEHNGFVLTGCENKFVEPRVLENHFKKILKYCNIPETNFHTLRHTFATNCVEVGFDVKSLSEILGHANVSITMNRYVHPSMDLKRDNMNKLTNVFTIKQCRYETK